MKVFAYLFVLGAFFSGKVLAGNADYIYLPTVEHGERELDFKYGTGRPANGERQTVASLGLGYGATEYWFTELYLKREVEGSSNVKLAEWENKFQLLETGKYPIELGLITEIEVPVSESGPWEFKFGPLLQTEFGKVQLNGNILFERKFSSDGSGLRYPTEVAYQGQVKYRMLPEFEYGVQLFGELGEWDGGLVRSDENNYKIGPAIFGKVVLSNRQAIKYNAAWLVGSGSATAENTFRMQLEYEF